MGNLPGGDRWIFHTNDQACRKCVHVVTSWWYGQTYTCKQRLIRSALLAVDIMASAWALVLISEYIWYKDADVARSKAELTLHANLETIAQCLREVFVSEPIGATCIFRPCSQVCSVVKDNVEQTGARVGSFRAGLILSQRSREVSKPRDVGLDLYDRSEIWTPNLAASRSREILW